jgi:proteasome lid subunit RPN8/RPN11
MKLELTLDPEIKQQILDHIESVLPEEGCGFLIGEGLIPEKAIAVTNRLHSPVRFEMEPVEQIRAMIWAEDNGMEIVAIYHSHPAGPAVPSPTDLAEFMYPGVASLIVSHQSGERDWHIRAFRIEEQHFEELSITERVNKDRPGG